MEVPHNEQLLTVNSLLQRTCISRMRHHCRHLNQSRSRHIFLNNHTMY